jgi:hypothetical protein
MTVSPKTGDTAICAKCGEELLWNSITSQWVLRDPGFKFPGAVCREGGDHIPRKPGKR